MNWFMLLAGKKACLAAGRIASRIHRHLPKRILPERCDVHVVMRRPLGLGDLVMLSPFMVALGQRWKRGKVLLVTEHLPFLDFDGMVEWMQPRDWRPVPGRTLVVSPTYSLRHLPHLTKGCAYLGYFLSNVAISSFAAAPLSYDPRTAHYLDRALGLLTLLGLSADNPGYPPLIETPFPGSIDLRADFVCIAPYSNWTERQFPADRYVDLARALSRRMQVVLIGSGDRKEREFIDAIAARCAGCNVLNLAGALRLTETTSLIRRARLFIGNDSGPAHIAYSCSASVLTLFGCVPPHTRLPRVPRTDSRIVALSSGGQCDLFPCYDGYIKPKCRRNLQCLTGTSTQAVLASAMELLS